MFVFELAVECTVLLEFLELVLDGLEALRFLTDAWTFRVETETALEAC